jgi:DNA replication ATP-dependent helicase Dna2
VVVGPTATGEAHIAGGFPATYLRFDLVASELLLAPGGYPPRSARPPAGVDLYVDFAKVDLTDLHLTAARDALGGSTSPLVAAMVLGAPSRVDRTRRETYEQLARGYDLDPSQRRAFALQAAAPVGLVQGPPGPGKTHVLGAVVASLLAERKRVLLCTMAHRAVNNALARSAERAAPEVPVYKVGDPLHGEGLPERVEVAGRGKPAAARVRRDRGPLLVGAVTAGVPTLVREGAEFDVVVFDEAGQLTLPQALCGALAAPRALFFGDHRQLPPIVQADHPDDGWGLERSAFETLTEHHPAVLLRTSYRLNAELAAFPSQAYYDGKLRASAASASARLALAVPHDDPLFPLLDPAAPLVWGAVAHRFRTAPCEEEAMVAVALIVRALAAGLAPEALAVVSPHRAQNQAIRARLRAAAADGATGADRVTVDTVDRIQGQEREVVVVSLALSDPPTIERQADFFYLPNRLNVAMTRARTKCILLASPELLRYRGQERATLRGITALMRLARLARVVAVDAGSDGAVAARPISQPQDVPSQPDAR